MAKTLTITIEQLDALEKEAAKLRRENKTDKEILAKVDGIRYAARKLKLALRADGVVESVQVLTNTPAAKRAPAGTKIAPAKKRTASKAA
jgi:hypothetical protein